MSATERPLVGVAVIIHDGKGNVVTGERAGSHGAGTLQLPGGHLEHSESFSDTAIREALEETGLIIGNVRFLTATNDVFPAEDEGGRVKHYVTIFTIAEVVKGDSVPRAMEPHKCAAWTYMPWHTLWAWCGAQASAADAGNRDKAPQRMFLPLENLWRERKEMEGLFDGNGKVALLR